jgi:hypothetical protein
MHLELGGERKRKDQVMQTIFCYEDSNIMRSNSLKKAGRIERQDIKCE